MAVTTEELLKELELLEAEEAEELARELIEIQRQEEVEGISKLESAKQGALSGILFST